MAYETTSFSYRCLAITLKHVLFTACVRRKVSIKKEEKIVVDKTLCALILKQNCQTLQYLRNIKNNLDKKRKKENC